MPASIYVTHAQLQAVMGVTAMDGADVVVFENSTLVDALDFWIMGETHEPNHHRSLIVEQDGTIQSDMVVPNNDII